MRKPRITIVGAGSLAHSLAPALRVAGYLIDEIVSRPNTQSLGRAGKLAARVHASAESTGTAELAAEIIWFCVPDGEIAYAARSLLKSANWRGKVAFHSSGALSSDELKRLKAQGAAIASVHPLMTFVADSEPSLAGVPFAMEGGAKAIRMARTIVSDLRGVPFNVRKSEKRAYHAWGMFASPFLTALLAMAERVAAAAHIDPFQARKKMIPILRQTISNYERFGAPGSFSGPIARGDVETVKKHLGTVRRVPSGVEVYIALARVALRNLPARNRSALEKILGDRTSPRKKTIKTPKSKATTNRPGIPRPTN